jgi:hypothetical protein
MAETGWERNIFFKECIPDRGSVLQEDGRRSSELTPKMGI